MKSGFIKSALRQFSLYRSLGEKTIARLSDAQLHHSPGENDNSIAVIMRHLHGNMLSRWTDFLTTDGEKPSRDRDAEFESDNEPKEKLLSRWNEGWHCLFDALEPLTDEDLQRTVTIRSEEMTAMEAIHRQIAHYAYHVGQIVYLGKMQVGDSWQSLSIPKKK
jgi:hypothetical protein